MVLIYVFLHLLIMKQSVPKLDLAPQLKRPLSLFNPCDYLLLFYWVFFFPQALRWYLENFGGGYVAKEDMTLQKGWELLRQNSNQRQLLIQGLLLTLISSSILSLLLQEIRVPLDWRGVAVGVAFGIVESVLVSLAFGVVGGVGAGVAVGVVGGVGSGVVVGWVLDVMSGIKGDMMSALAVAAAVGMAGCVALALAWSVTIGIAGGMARGIPFGIGGGLVISLAVGLVGGIAGAVVGNPGIGLAGFVMVVTTVGTALLRPEDWLLGLMFNRTLLQNRGLLLSHVTSLRLSPVSSEIKNWLNQDSIIGNLSITTGSCTEEKSRSSGIHNINQLLKYSLQFISVVEAVNQFLDEFSKRSSDQVIVFIHQLSEDPFDWNLVRFCSASLSNDIRSETVEGIFFFLPSEWRKRIQSSLLTDLRLDSSCHAAAAGFWYLHEKDPYSATKAFAKVRSLLYGEEMYTLANILSKFSTAKDVTSIATLNIPVFPADPHLHPTTWQTLNSLRRVVEDVQLIERGTNRLARSSALNRAIGELQEIININSETPNPQQVPKAERKLILDIVKTWQTELHNIAKDIGQIIINEPIPIPYVIGSPVEGQLFAGREDILRELQELWGSVNKLQSVILYGHRRMGKTSILKNINQRLDGNIQLIHINLQGLGEIQHGLSDVLIAIADEIANTFKLVPPKDEDLINFPERTFKRFLQAALESIPNQGLIIALDEFETLEDLIKAKKIPASFMEVIRTWTQLSPKLGFIFAGLHTLQEMTADYFQPFFASFIPKQVSFLDKASTRYLLAEPNEDFPLTYTGETLDKIYALTHGQPFLVQLVGFQLVRRFNKQLEQPTPPKNTLTLEDLEAVINADFFQQGRYYFEGIWKQASEGAIGQQAILRVLAPHPAGLTQADLLASTQLTPTQCTEAIDTLKRHDVIQEREGRFAIVVELFRRWVKEIICDRVESDRVR
jgi:hypothetical protein